MLYFQRGMSWLEAAMTVLLLSVFGWYLAQRLENFQEFAERADMEYAATMMKSALRVEVGLLMVQGRMQDAARLQCDNPVHWLDKVPANYYGEARGDALMNVPRGSWYFDPVECSMAYMVRHDAHFVPDSQGLRRVRFKVRGDARDAAGRSTGLRFEPVEPYQWGKP